MFTPFNTYHRSHMITFIHLPITRSMLLPPQSKMNLLFTLFHDVMKLTERLPVSPLGAPLRLHCTIVSVGFYL